MFMNLFIQVIIVLSGCLLYNLLSKYFKYRKNYKPSVQKKKVKKIVKTEIVEYMSKLNNIIELQKQMNENILTLMDTSEPDNYTIMEDDYYR